MQQTGDGRLTVCRETSQVVTQQRQRANRYPLQRRSLYQSSTWAFVRLCTVGRAAGNFGPWWRTGVHPLVYRRADALDQARSKRAVVVAAKVRSALPLPAVTHREPGSGGMPTACTFPE